MAKRIEVKMGHDDDGTLEERVNKAIDDNKDMNEDERDDIKQYTKAIDGLIDQFKEKKNFQGCICIVKTKVGGFQVAMFDKDYDFDKEWWLIQMAEAIDVAQRKRGNYRDKILKDKQAQKMLRKLWRKAPSEIRKNMTYKGFSEGLVDVCIDKLDKGDK